MEVLLQNPMHILLYIGNSLFALSVVLLLLYAVQVQSFRSRTKKYKFVSERESHALMGSAVLFSGSVAFYAFVLMELSIGIAGPFYYFIAGLFAVGVGFALGYVLRSYLNFYHPFILEKRLKDIRFAPMRSPITGKPMTLLNEAQEDVHLSREMIEEEDTLSVDYDVWIDENSGFKVIEQYDTRYHPRECESCHFKTLVKRKEEVIQAPQPQEKGILRKHYECTYCGHLESKDVDLPSWNEEGRYEEYAKDIYEPSIRKVST